MTEDNHARGLSAIKSLLEKFGFETFPGTQTFPWIATNGEIVTFVYSAKEPLPQVTEKINRELSGVYFERRLGPLSQNMYVLVLVDEGFSEAARTLVESDAHICRKFVVPAGETTDLELNRNLRFLSQFDMKQHRITSDKDLENRYLETFREEMSEYPLPAADALIQALQEGRTPTQIVEAIKTIEGLG